jgi:hypothetical protein
VFQGTVLEVLADGILFGVLLGSPVVFEEAIGERGDESHCEFRLVFAEEVADLVGQLRYIHRTHFY